MGWQASAHVMDHAPDGLTYREYAALLVLANAAWDTGKRAGQIPGVEGNKELIRRLRLPSRSRRFAVLQSLVAKGALEHVERGRHGTGATYAIAGYEPRRVRETGTLHSVEGSRFSTRRVPVFDAKGPRNRDPLQTRSTRPKDRPLSPRSLHERLSEVAGSEITEREFEEFKTKISNNGGRNWLSVILSAIKTRTAAELVESLRAQDEEGEGYDPSWNQTPHIRTQSAYKPF
jgi:hypothetical protein